MLILEDGKELVKIARSTVEKFFEKGIEVKVIGASAISYSENKWWENEYGLLALNNEYVKLMYYCFK